jgi:hypothetical protein
VGTSIDNFFTTHICSGGEIGIHEGLKIPWPLGREGSSPSPSTIFHKK